MANEYEKDIATAYRMNHPTVNVIQGDIRDITEAQLRAVMGDEGIDIIVGGGPPCQSYSTLGKRQMDERAHLFEEYSECFRLFNPRCSYLKMCQVCSVCKAVIL